VTTGQPGVVAPGPTSARRGGLLREHDFRLLWIGETTSALGTTISHLALPLVAVVTLQVSTFQVSVLTAASWVPWLVVGLPAGAWVDRLPRRPVMLVCNAASFTLLLSVPIAAWMGMLTFGHLLAVALLTGVASVFFSTAYQVYLPSTVTAEHLMEANAKLQGSESAAQVAGPSLAGLLAQVAGAVTGLAADALSFAVSSICLLRIRAREEPAATTRRPSTLLEEIGDGLRFLRADPYLRVLTVFGALSNLALTGYQAILVVFLIREVGVSPAVVGLLLSGMSVGGVIGAAGATAIARRFGAARGLLLSEICTVPLGLLIPLTAPGPRLLLVSASCWRSEGWMDCRLIAFFSPGDITELRPIEPSLARVRVEKSGSLQIQGSRRRASAAARSSPPCSRPARRLAPPRLVVRGCEPGRCSWRPGAPARPGRSCVPPPRAPAGRARRPFAHGPPVPPARSDCGR
jgi:MFS family permease